jgi:hypothetical protein
MLEQKAATSNHIYIYIYMWFLFYNIWRLRAHRLNECWFFPTVRDHNAYIYRCNISVNFTKFIRHCIGNLFSINNSFSESIYVLFVFFNYLIIFLMQFWSPYFKIFEFLSPYFKSLLYGPPILVFQNFGHPTQFVQFFLICQTH